jgi:fumarate reductase flavoprotein subunit
MAGGVRNTGFASPDEHAIDAAVAACESPFGKKTSGGLEPIRERLYDIMWEKVGIIRDAGGLEEAKRGLEALETQLDAQGLADHNRSFNLSWHDWMNLKSLIAVSRAIAAAAAARRDSRGAHCRSDYPDAGPLETSAFTSLRLQENALRVETKPVAFTRVRPGQTLLKHVA